MIDEVKYHRLMRHPHYQTWIERISKITPDLYVGELMCRSYGEFLRAHGIESVISLLSVEHQKKYGARCPVAEGFNSHTFDIDDGDTLMPAQIDEVLDAFQGVTLVHCISGSNRSTCIAIASLLRGRMHPIDACHRYWTERGRQMAKVYKTTPRMSAEMLDNLMRYHESLNS